MTGGQLNLIAVGSQDIILTGNPEKTFFKTTYSKYSNFGMEKYRVDFTGNPNISEQQSSVYKFQIPRHGELLMDTYAVMDIPNIWSSFYGNDFTHPYEFQWIEYLGCMMIEKVEIVSGGTLLQQFSGEYIKNSIERDIEHNKLNQFYSMIGHTKDIYNPANAFDRNNNYPNVKYNLSEPSIKGKKLYVPLPFWYTHSSKMALPLVHLQYSIIEIIITIRPIKHLYTILDKNGVRKSPNMSDDNEQLYHFVQQRKDVYDNFIKDWNLNLHLMNTVAFLDTTEMEYFAKNNHSYLIKDIREINYLNVVGTQRINIESNNLVTSWMWFLRRNDAYKRNEWSNYTNWKYKNKPNVPMEYDLSRHYTNLPELTSENNNKFILNKLSISIDGKIRENEIDADVYSHIEKFRKCNGSLDDGTYIYSYSINLSNKELQPSGAINLAKFKKIYMDIETIKPEANPDAKVETICDIEGNVIGVLDVPQANNYLYGFDFTLFEERYNVIEFTSGMIGLKYAR